MCFCLQLSSNVITRVCIDNVYHIKPAKYHGVGTLWYDMTLVLALLFFLHKYMSILLPLFITSFGVAVRGKGKLTILALISPYSEKPKVRHVSDFNLGSLT